MVKNPYKCRWLVGKFILPRPSVVHAVQQGAGPLIGALYIGSRQSWGRRRRYEPGRLAADTGLKVFDRDILCYGIHLLFLLSK